MLAIRVTGDAFEQGRLHGEAFAVQARRLYHRYCGAIDVQNPAVRDGVRKMEANLDAVCPEILQELHGIAAGAGMAYEDLLLLNGSIEFGAISDHARCSSVVFGGTPYGSIHGHNHDVDPPLAVPFVVGERVEAGGSVTAKRVIWTGTVWTAVAVNSFGLTSSVADVWVTDSNWECGIPINTLTTLPTRRCKSVDEAVDLLREVAPINFGYNFLLSDSAGNAAVVERSPTRCAVRYLQGRALWCTNHFCQPETQGVMASPPELLRNSHDRWRQLEQMTARSDWSRDMDGLQDTMRSHAQPGGLCQHAGPGQAGLYTSHSYIMIPSQQQLLIADGLPCRYPYLPLESWIA